LSSSLSVSSQSVFLLSRTEEGRETHPMNPPAGRSRRGGQTRHSSWYTCLAPAPLAHPRCGSSAPQCSGTSWGWREGRGSGRRIRRSGPVGRGVVVAVILGGLCLRVGVGRLCGARWSTLVPYAAAVEVKPMLHFSESELSRHRQDAT
jgi:hypothetical protein